MGGNTPQREHNPISPLKNIPSSFQCPSPLALGVISQLFFRVVCEKGDVLYTKGLLFLVVIISPNYLETGVRLIKIGLIREMVATIPMPWLLFPQIYKQGYSWGGKECFSCRETSGTVKD